MKLLILAAGKGERLFPLTANTPKSLLEVGGGVTLLEAQLRAAEHCKIREIVLVTGYKAEQIEAKIHDLPFSVTNVFNPFFDVSNNLISAWLARPHMHEPFVLLNGDVVFRPEVLERLSHSVNGDIQMVIDRKQSYDDDDMKVATTDDRVLRVSKKLPPGSFNGESIGMIRFSAFGARVFAQTLDRMVRDAQNRNVFYLAALQAIMDSGVPVSFLECQRDDWAEIDFHPDLKLLRDNIRRFDDRIVAWELAANEEHAA